MSVRYLGGVVICSFCKKAEKEVGKIGQFIIPHNPNIGVYACESCDHLGENCIRQYCMDNNLLTSASGSDMTHKVVDTDPT